MVEIQLVGRHGPEALQFAMARKGRFVSGRWFSGGQTPGSAAIRHVSTFSIGSIS